MKLSRPFFILSIAVFFLISSTSCLVFTPHHVGGGSSRGSFKNSNNPHHPNTTNPGHTKGKRK
jgi:hypothetical protein